MAKMETLQVKRSPAQFYTEMIVERVKANGAIPPENKQAMEELVSYHRSRGSRPSTIRKWVYGFERFLWALGNTPIPSATKQDIERAFADIEGQDGAEETKRQIRVVVKQYFKHAFGNDEVVPPQCRWLKTSIDETDDILPDRLISEKDIVSIINACRDNRSKAMFSLLWDRGLRAGELVGMQKADVCIDEDPPYVVVRVSKTKARRIAISFSAGYIAAYLAEDKIKALKPTDLLWRDLFKDAPLQYNALNAMLKGVVERTPELSNRRINLHLFRHSAATRLCLDLEPPAMNEVFGWSRRSTVSARYYHLSGKRVDAALLKADGLEPGEEPDKIIQIRQCPQCRFPNINSAYHCARPGCNKLLVIRKAEDILKNKDLMRSLVTKAIRDDKFFDDLLKEQF